MFKISNKKISITKGDTAVLNVELKFADGTAYTMATGDKLTLTVRKKPNSSVLMEIESTTTRIVLPHNKTANLEIGSLCFDIQLTTAAGEIYTVLGVTSPHDYNFIVYPEITE